MPTLKTFLDRFWKENGTQILSGYQEPNDSMKSKEKKHSNIDFLQKLYNGDKRKIQEHIVRCAYLDEKAKLEKELFFRAEKLKRFQESIPIQFKTEFTKTPEYQRYQKEFFTNQKDLLIPGKIQKGKTRYAIEIGNENIIQGGDTVFLPLIECTFWNTQKFTEFTRQLNNGKLIIIDDFVEKTFKETRWTREKLQPLVKILFSKNIRLIFTLNNSLDDVRGIWDNPRELDGKISQRIQDARFFIWKDKNGKIRPIRGRNEKTQ